MIPDAPADNLSDFPSLQVPPHFEASIYDQNYPMVKGQGLDLGKDGYSAVLLDGTSLD